MLQTQPIKRLITGSSASIGLFATLILASFAAQGVTEIHAVTQSQPLAPTPTQGRPEIQAGSDAALRSAISDDVADAWRRSDFAHLDATAQQYVQTRARTYSGKWRLSIFYSALSTQMDIEWPKQWYGRMPDDCDCKIPDPAHYEEAGPMWDRVQAKLDAWIKQAPNSAHAKVARAQMLINRAWFYRGSGYARSVRPEAWPLVERYLEESRKFLMDHPDVRLADPEWYNEMFFIATAQSWGRPQVDELIQDFRKSGHLYLTGYQSAATFMTPKWGGSYAELEEFARQAIVDNGDEGLDAYTRIYWNTVRADELAQSRADWSTLKRGFESILRKYPDARNVNGLAMYACGAGDAETFRNALNRMSELDPQAWTISLNTCKRLLTVNPAGR